MYSARIALALACVALGISTATVIGCSDSSEPAASTNKNPTDPDDDGEPQAPAKDSGTATKDGGGTMNKDAGPHDASTTTTPTCATNGAKALSIEPNHSTPHTVADLPAADFAESATADKQYMLTPGGGGGGGGAGQHTHTVTLTRADRTKLAAGQSVSVVSTPGGNSNHTHTVAFGCK